MINSLSEIEAVIRSNLDLFDYVSNEDKKLEVLLLRLKNRCISTLTRQDIFEIARVKSTRKADLVKQNDEISLSKILKCVFECENDEARIRVLSSLAGVGIPTASAILSWTFPNDYGVIDRRAWQTLYQFKLVAHGYTGQFTVKMFLDYTNIIRALARTVKRTPQEIDIWLYRYDRDVAPYELRVAA